MKVLIEYGKEAEVLEQTEGGYKVRYQDRDAIIEKIIKYKPLEIDGWKYTDGTLVRYRNQMYSLKQYTVWVRENVAMFYYSLEGITRFDDNTHLSEDQISKDCEIVTESPFLSLEDWQEEQTKLYDLIAPLNKQITALQAQVREHESTFGLEQKCRHSWYLYEEEEINNGKTTKREYECEVCGKRDPHYWHNF